MFLNKRIKEYKRKNDMNLKKKRSIQFISMFKSVSRELNLFGRSRNEIKNMFDIIGNTEDSSDVFIKIILILHIVGGIGVNTLQSSSTVDELSRLDLVTVFDLLTDSWVIVSEMLEGSSEKVVAEPFLLYKSIRSYVSILHINKQRNEPRQNYYTRLDGSLGKNIIPNVNMVEHQGSIQDDDPDDELYMASQDL